jgi:hypothetical protein
MRTPLHIIAACTALTVICTMAGLRPAHARKPTKGEIAESCAADLGRCIANCPSGSGKMASLCEQRCVTAQVACERSGGIFIDPQRADNPPKPKRGNLKPPYSSGLKPGRYAPPRHHRHPVNVGVYKSHSKGMKQGNGNGHSVILRSSTSQHANNAHHSGGSKH